MFKKILAPLDGSDLAEQVLPYISLLTKGLEAQVDLLRVIEPLPPVGLTDPARDVYRQRILSELHQDAEEYLDGVASDLREQGITVSTTVVHGDPPSLILAEVEGHPDTMIAMSTQGRSGIARWVLGSVTDKVLHSTTNPLLVIRCREQWPEPDINLSIIIVPLDGSALAERILPHVVYLAKAMKIKVDLVTVMPAIGDAPCLFEILPVFGEGPGQEVMEQAKTYLHQTAEKMRRDGLAMVEEHVLQGHPAVAIIYYARSVPDNIVAMASHGRSGIGRWLLGSITDLVARNSGDPVLVVHTPEPESDRG